MMRHSERALPFPSLIREQYLWTLLCGLALALAGHLALGQDVGQTQRLGTTEQSKPTGPAVQPGTPQTQNAPQSSGNTKSRDPVLVNQTGGIINNHPDDVLNQPRYIWPEEIRDQSDVVQVPAPRVVDISELNQNASSIQYEDRGRGPFSFAVEATGIYTSNLYNQFKNPQSGAYFDVAFPIRMYLASPRSNFGIFNRTSTSLYPGNTHLNHWSSIFSAVFNHRVSSLTDWTMDLAGGRTTGIGTYLQPAIPVGSTKIVQAGAVNGLLPTYNLAGSYGLTHRLSERDRVVTSLTGAWLEQPLGPATSTSKSPSTRQQTAGLDVHFQHATSVRSAVGVETTDIFIRGLSPVGHSNYASVKGTYQYSVTEHGVLEFGAGPLFSASSSRQFGSSSKVSYAANASVTYQTAFGKIGGGYARVVQLGYLLPSSAGNQFFGLYDRPLNRYVDLTAAATYVRTGSQIRNQADFTDVGVSSRLNFNFTRSLVFYTGYSYFDQKSQGTSLSHQDVAAGLTYSFGSSLARKGDSK
jgi:hypothetical protein